MERLVPSLFTIVLVGSLMTAAAEAQPPRSPLLQELNAIAIHTNLHDAVIPGFALQWDLADLRERLRPRSVIWKDPTDWMGNVLALEGSYVYTASDPNAPR